jgi:hypothetical protein
MCNLMDISEKLLECICCRCLIKAPQCFGKYVKLLVPPAFVVVSTHSSFMEDFSTLTYQFIIIIISPLQSTAGHKRLQLLAIPLDLRLHASSSCQPSCINRHFTWLEGAYTTFTETRSPLQNSFTLAVIGSTADMASPPII